jgi:hypothetical protein
MITYLNNKIINQALLALFLLFIFTSIIPATALSQSAEKKNQVPINNSDNNPTAINNKNLGWAGKTEAKNKGKNSILNLIDSMAQKSKTPSIMYKPQELKDIDRAIEAYNNKEKFLLGDEAQEIESIKTPEDNAKSYIYLSSILYHSPNNWSVWINDKKISKEDNKFGDELYIKSINKDRAEIIWTMSLSKWKIISNNKQEDILPPVNNNQVEFNFSLSFNQTYMLNGNKIVEGRLIPIADIKSASNNPSNTINQEP